MRSVSTTSWVIWSAPTHFYLETLKGYINIQSRVHYVTYMAKNKFQFLITTKWVLLLAIAWWNQFLPLKWRFQYPCFNLSKIIFFTQNNTNLFYSIIILNYIVCRLYIEIPNLLSITLKLLNYHKQSRLYKEKNNFVV